MVRENPAWSNRVLQHVMPAIRKRVKKAWLPIERASGKYREYGTGRYGVALPTHDPAVVLKLTSDWSESLIAAWLAAKKRPPVGIVRYMAVYEIDGSMRYQGQNRQLYGLWRESANFVGGIQYWAASRGLKKEWLAERPFIEDTGETAHTLVKKLLRDRDEVRAFFVIASKAYDRAMSVEPQNLKRRHRALQNRHAAADVLERILIGARVMQKGKVLVNVGNAILQSFRGGLFLSDAHSGNLGVVRRNGKEVVVITDPGRAVPIKASFRKPSIKRA